MTESTQTRATLELSPRDVQCVVMLVEVCATILSTYATEADMIGNCDALEHLFDAHYSEPEYDALRQRARALLPVDSPMTFYDPRLRVSGSTVLS